jgi:hypothetical protein
MSDARDSNTNHHDQPPSGEELRAGAVEVGVAVIRGALANLAEVADPRAVPDRRKVAVAAARGALQGGLKQLADPDNAPGKLARELEGRFGVFSLFASVITGRNVRR